MSKVLITVPDELLARIDREVCARRTTRSRFLEEAARRQLGWQEEDAFGQAFERAREALADVGAFRSAEVIRSERDARDAADRHRL